MKTWDLTDKTLTDSGNDVTAAYGVIKMSEELYALKCRIQAALEIVKGELQDSNIGVDYFGIVLTDAPLQIKVQELNRVISSVEGVSSVEFKGSTVNKTTLAQTFEFTIKSVYGDIEINKTFENIL